MNTLIKNIMRFALLMLVQVFVLDKIRLHYLITPYIYYFFILWMPFNMARSWQMIVAFVLGFTLDSFRHTPGFHAAACVLIAYIRPYIINILIPQEGANTNYEEPSVKSMGGVLQYSVYAGILTLVHHTWLFLLEASQFGNTFYFLVKTLFSAVVSAGLLIIVELLFSRKQKFRTNTI